MAVLQASVALLPAQFLQFVLWLQSLVSPLARTKANNIRNDSNKNTRTSVSFGSQATLCLQKERSRTTHFPAPHSKKRTSGPHTSGGAHSRGAAAQTTPTPFPATCPVSGCPAAFCSTSVTFGIVLHPYAREGPRTRARRGRPQHLKVDIRPAFWRVRPAPRSAWSMWWT